MPPPTLSGQNQTSGAMNQSQPENPEAGATYESTRANPKPYDRLSIGWILADSGLENELEEDAVLGLMNMRYDKTQTRAENSTANDSPEKADGSPSTTLSGSSVKPDMADWTQNESEGVSTGNSSHADQHSTNATQYGHTERARNSHSDHEDQAHEEELSTKPEEPDSGLGMSQMTIFQPSIAQTAQASAEDPNPSRGPNQKTIRAKDLEILIERTGIPNPKGPCHTCRRQNKICKVLSAQRTHVCGLCIKLKQKCKFDD